MAGDMNFHYGPAQYPRDLLASYGFTSTYDLTGTSFPTGDHRGATIDYVFLKDSSQFTVLGQYNQELYSDHDAVTADLAFTGGARHGPGQLRAGRLHQHPERHPGRRRTVLDLMVKAIDNTPAGGSIHLTTAKLGDKPIYRALRAAIDRKVHVQVVTRRNHPSQQEQNLMNVLGDKVWKKDFAVGCEHECRAIESRGKLPQTRLLVSQSGDHPGRAHRRRRADGLLGRQGAEHGAGVDQPGDVRRCVQAVLPAGGARAVGPGVRPVLGRETFVIAAAGLAG